MKVKDLVVKLSQMDQEAEVYCWPYDGQMNSSPADDVQEYDSKAVRWDAIKQDWITEKVQPFVLIE